MRLGEFVGSWRRGPFTDVEDSQFGQDFVRAGVRAFVGDADAVIQPLAVLDIELAEVQRETMLEVLLAAHGFDHDWLTRFVLDGQLQFQRAEADVIGHGHVDRDNVVWASFGAVIPLDGQPRSLIRHDDQFSRHGVIVRQLVNVFQREQERPGNGGTSSHFERRRLLRCGKFKLLVRIAVLSPDKLRGLDRLVEFECELQPALLKNLNRTDRTVERLRGPTGIRGRLNIEPDLRDDRRFDDLDFVVARFLTLDGDAEIKISHDMWHQRDITLASFIERHRSAIGRAGRVAPFESQRLQRFGLPALLGRRQQFDIGAASNNAVAVFNIDDPRSGRAPVAPRHQEPLPELTIHARRDEHRNRQHQARRESPSHRRPRLAR